MDVRRFLLFITITYAITLSNITNSKNQHSIYYRRLRTPPAGVLELNVVHYEQRELIDLFLEVLNDEYLLDIAGKLIESGINKIHVIEQAQTIDSPGGFHSVETAIMYLTEEQMRELGLESKFIFIITPLFEYLDYKQRLLNIEHELWHVYVDTKYTESLKARERLTTEINRLTGVAEIVVNMLRSMVFMAADINLSRYQIKEGSLDAALNNAQRLIEELDAIKTRLLESMAHEDEYLLNLFIYYPLIVLPFEIENLENQAQQYIREINKIFMGLVSKRRMNNLINGPILELKNTIIDNDYPTVEELQRIFTMFSQILGR